MKERQINLNLSDLTKMKDFLGNELQIGDEVVYIQKGGCGSINLQIGRIYEFKRGYAYVVRISDNLKWSYGLSSVSIMKIGAQII